MFHHTMGCIGAFTLRLTLLLCFTASLTFALPSHYGRNLTVIRPLIYTSAQDLVADDRSDITGNDTDQSMMDSGSASDGAGSGFDIPMVLWLSFGLAVGFFLTLGGIRLWRITTAFAIGLVVALCVWVAIVNATNSKSLSDLVLTLITLSSFVLGSLCGLFKFCNLAGLTALSILGGMSVGIRLVLIREELLLRPTGLNWVIIVVCAAAGFAITLFRQKLGIALSCTFTGTFFLSLGMDLAVNQQNGVSSGLRHLLDGNNAHILALRDMPYKPPVSTQVLLILPIFLALAMAYAQLRLFSHYIEEPNRGRPFTEYLTSIYPTRYTEKLDTDSIRLPLQRPPVAYSNSRFSL